MICNMQDIEHLQTILIIFARELKLTNMMGDTTMHIKPQVCDPVAVVVVAVVVVLVVDAEADLDLGSGQSVGQLAGLDLLAGAELVELELDLELVVDLEQVGLVADLDLLADFVLPEAV